MTPSAPQKRAEERWRFVPALVGAVMAGRRKGDGLVRMGFAGLVVAGVLHLLERQLSEDRKLRAEERTALVTTLRETGQATAAAMQALAGEVAKEDGALRDIRAVVVDRNCNGRGR